MCSPRLTMVIVRVKRQTLLYSPIKLCHMYFIKNLLIKTVNAGSLLSNILYFHRSRYVLDIMLGKLNRKQHVHCHCNYQQSSYRERLHLLLMERNIFQYLYRGQALKLSSIIFFFIILYK